LSKYVKQKRAKNKTVNAIRHLLMIVRLSGWPLIIRSDMTCDDNEK
jgi:hypothetical protein